jgi:hypothetical protein
MSGRTGVAVTISATDAASAKIDAINKRLAAMNAPVDRVQKSLAKFADLSGISKLQRGVEGLASSGLSAFESLGRIVPVLGTLTGAASLAGMAALVFRWGEFGQKLQFAATRAGLSAQALYGLQGSARLAGVSASDLTSGMTTLGEKMNDAIGGRDPQAYSYLELLTKGFWHTAEGARSVEEVTPKLADAIASLRNPFTQARAAVAVFGGAGERMLPWLRKGAVGIAELTTLQARYGVVTDAGTKAALELETAHQRLMLSIDGLTNSISEKLAPILGPMLIQMAEWVAANRDWIATGIGGAVKDFATWVQSVDWKGIGEGAINFARGADQVAQSVGGWYEAAKLLFEFWVGKMTLGILASIVKIDAALSGSILGRVLGLAGLPLALTGDTPQGPQPQETGIQHWLGQGGVMETWIRNHLLSPPTGHGMGGGRAGPRRSSAEQDQAGQDSLAFWMSKGLSPERAAGMAAQEIAESGGNPNSRGDGGDAHGAYQWHANRRANIRAGTGIDVSNSTIQQQREAAYWELTHTERGAYALLQGAQTAGQAGSAATEFERPGNRMAAALDRAAIAERILRLRQEPPHRLLTGAEMQPLPRGYYGPNGFAPDAPALPGPRMDSLRPPVNINSGSGSSGGGDLNVKGGAALTVKVQAPPGTTVGATTSGDLFQGAPRIEQTTVGRSPGGSP